MITVEELYSASAGVLLQTEASGDGHYFFGETELGRYRLDTHCNHTFREDVPVSEHRTLLQQRMSLIAVQMIDWLPVGEYVALLAYPCYLAENGFDMENLVHVLGGPPDPNTLMAFNTERLVDPNEPWLAAIFASLQEHAG